MLLTEKLVERLWVSSCKALLLMSIPLMLCEYSVLRLPSLWQAARFSVKYCMGNSHFQSPYVCHVFDSPMIPDDVRSEGLSTGLV